MGQLEDLAIVTDHQGHQGEASHPLPERDAMVCRHCGKEERASEGYPCLGCGTFICLICTFRGYQHCLSCEANTGETLQASS